MGDEDVQSDAAETKEERQISDCALLGGGVL